MNEDSHFFPYPLTHHSRETPLSNLLIVIQKKISLSPPSQKRKNLHTPNHIPRFTAFPKNHSAPPLIRIPTYPDLPESEPDRVARVMY